MKNYSFKKYVYLDRWVSYWHQVNEVLNLEVKEVLEIGPGQGTVADCLKKEGIKVKTLDISSDLKPDIVASVENIPLADNSVELILCAEVLEHLPFEKFEPCLRELKRVAKKYLVLSLPHFGPSLKFSLKTPFLRQIQLAWKIPYQPKHQTGGKHQWEIGKKGFSPGKIRKIISQYFYVRKDFIPFENQYHHFYILEKRHD